MAKSLNRQITPLQLLVYTGVVGLLISALIFGSTTFLDIKFDAGTSVQTWLLVGLVTLCLCAGLFSFVIDATLEEKSIHLPIACFIAASVGIIELSSADAVLPIKTYFYLTFTCNAVLVYCTAHVIINAMQLRGHWPSTIAMGATVALTLVGIACLLSQSALSLTVSSRYIVAVRAAIVAGLPLVAFILFASVKSLHVNAGAMRESLLLRLQASSRNNTDIGTITIATLCSTLIALATFILIRQKNLSYPIGAMASIVPVAIWFNYRKAKLGFNDKSEQTVSAALAAPSAKRFLKRHLSYNMNWAASAGIRTPNFIIDHDPDGMVSGNLPATITQIRNMEIENCISQLLGSAYLHNRVVGSQIFGAIDPELSMRPCIDLLMMFAGLHLDAVALVERRLSGLVDLLPILDPELAKHIDNDDIDKMLTRDLWLYHFDYTWADQQLVRTNFKFQYDVHHNLAPSTFRIKVFEYLKSKNRIGNFIWIGANARERLLREAPMLSQIVQAWPVPVGDDEEHLVFLIKFEELIPRLQKYFGLEEKRFSLQDYEPSPEALRFLNVVDLQLQNSNDLNSLYQVVSSLTSFPWRGFKEKDRALTAVKLTFEAAIAELGKTPHLSPGQYDQQFQAIRGKFIRGIVQIGYPSQLLHLAQLNKIAMRDAAIIIRNASQPWNARFHESWLLLSSSDSKRYSSDDVSSYLKFVLSVPDAKALRMNIFVQCKAIEVFINLGAEATFEPGSIHEKIVDRYAVWLIETKAPVDVCILFLDGLHYLEQQIGHKLSMHPDNIARLDQYFQGLTTLLGQNSHGSQAILSRWHRNTTEALKSA